MNKIKVWKTADNQNQKAMTFFVSFEDFFANSI